MIEKRIIQVNEIEEILKKYNIGKKPLALVLGWGEVTIIRYLEGQIPDQFHSDILLKIKEDYHEFLKYLEKNKEFITNLAYKKVIGKISELKLEEDQSKIYLIVKHIIAKMEDITPLALQKILYYIEGFSLALFDKDLLDSDCEAWVHGPVYREIYDRFSYYSYHTIEKEEFHSYLVLDNMERESQILIDKIIQCFGCYSGKVLESMTHQTTPWLEARENTPDDEVSNQMISKDKMKEYFIDICEKYHISTIDDISKYSTKIFKKVVR